jgi:hypothetical protein
MKIGIISDIHDNIPNLDKCLNWLKKEGSEKIICLGDITNIDTASYLAECFSKEIFIVRGNADNYDQKEISGLKNITYLKETGAIKIEEILIGLVHEPFKISSLTKNEGKIFNFIFYGHTHKPWIEKADITTIANPGNLAGTNYQASFALLNTKTKNLELKILERL